MGEELTISLKNVSKCFKRYARPIDRLKEVLLPGKVRAEEFWALQNISLDVFRGETFGVIGRNGSGKSTLLQIVAGTLTPTTGQVYVNGRLSALLELGSGFNPEFTGQQNIFFNGRILGLKQEEIEAKYEDIIAFADIGDFINQPVKTYSSGMFIRLAFAVAANCEPQILIVDEALAVGDIFFQQKCFKFLENLRSKGVSIVFVGHDMQAVMKLCDRAAILQNGLLITSGSPAEMVAKYTKMYYSQVFEEEMANSTDATSQGSHGRIITYDSSELSGVEFLVAPDEFISEFPKSDRFGGTIGLISGVAISDKNGKQKQVFESGETLVVSIKINRHLTSICPLNIGFQIKNRLGQVVIGTNTFFMAVDTNSLEFGEPFLCQFSFKLSVLPQQYTLNAAVGSYDQAPKFIYDWIEDIALIEVITMGNFPSQIGLCFPEIKIQTTHLIHGQSVHSPND